MSDTPIKKQALLIGINKYDILPELKYARQDAEAVDQSLKYNYCFSDNEVMLLTDSRAGMFKPSNQLRILSYLDNLANQDLDLFIFGFWGHGVVRNGKRYLCPIDVSPDEVEQLGVPFDVLMNKLIKIRAKNTCLILDCCQRIHDGERGEEETLTAADQKTIENAARDIVFKRRENEPDFQSNVAILNSCKQGQAAYEWDNRKHGIFTAHLLDAMNRRYSSLAQIVGYVSSNVEKTARELNKQQTPLCTLEGDIPLPIDTKSAPLVTGDVFVSYRHSNEKLVEPIEKELKKRGISYFIDRVGVNYTMEYASAIAQAVKECKVLLFVWTQDADVSPDILREVSMALTLNKRVLPYKIGSFNVTEHNSLFFQLSPISRYEVPKQTQETIEELINRVQQALTGKTYQQYSFTIPDNSADAVIVKPKIHDINIVITPTVIEQQKPIKYDKISLPSKPEALLRIPAENVELRHAIEQLKSFTHESLAQANIALQQTKAQLELWEKRREERWKDLPKSIQQLWENVITFNPDCTEKDINLRETWEEMIANNSYRTDESQNQLYFDLLEKFHCGKKYQQAKRELERVKQERTSKCNKAVARFQQKIEDNKRRYNVCMNNFFDEVIMKILTAMPGYKDIDAPFPANEIIDPLRQLDKYELGWKAPDETNRARELWRDERPCVISKKNTEERTRIWNERTRLWNDFWKKVTNAFLIFVIFSIGIALLFVGKSFVEAYINDPYLTHLFWASLSIIAGILLTVSTAFYCFGENDFLKVTVRSLYFLAGATFLTIGGLYWNSDYFPWGLFLIIAGLTICYNAIKYLFSPKKFDKELEESIGGFSIIFLFISGGILLWYLEHGAILRNFAAFLALFIGLGLMCLPLSNGSKKTN